MELWYPMLWKHKSPFHIYHTHDAFLGCCITILTRIVLDRFTQEAKYFLKGKGLLYLEEEYSFIRLFSYEESYVLLPNFVTYKFFILEACIQYLSWFSFFEKKCKFQFIQIPFSVVDVQLRNSTHMKVVT